MAQNNYRNNSQDVALIQPPRMQMPEHVAAEYNIDPDSWRALTDAVFPSAKTVGAVVLALAYCKKNRLDIFQRPVHIVPIYSNGKMMESVWPGIGLLRIIAQRQGEFAGYDDCEFGPDITETFEGTIEKWDEGQGGRRQKVGVEKVSKQLTYPEWARFVVYKTINGERIRMPGPKVYWLETYAQAGRNNPVPNDMWTKRPRGQIEKCFSPDTEVLTLHGFQRFDQVSSPVMQVLDTGLEVSDAQPFCQDWVGPMILSDGQSLNFMVTPNHDMVTTTGKIEAGDMLMQATSVAKFHIPLALDGTKPDLGGISDEQIRLVGAFLCDGSGRAGQSTCNIAVSRERKIHALEDIGLYRSTSTRNTRGQRATGRGGRIIVAKADKIVFHYPVAAMGGLIAATKAPNWSMLSQLSLRQARLLTDTMIEFDGATGPTYRRFYTSSKMIAGIFEMAAVAGGYSVSPRRERTSDISILPNFCITLSAKSKAPVLAKSDKAEVVSSVKTNLVGKVWCVTVPSGVIVVRRNGLSMLCGNCAEAGALRRAFPDVLGNEYAAEEMEGRPHGDPIEGTYVEVDGGEVKGNTKAATSTKPKRSDYHDKQPAEKSMSHDAGEETHAADDAGASSTEGNPLDGTGVPNNLHDWQGFVGLLKERLATFVHIDQVDEEQNRQQFRIDAAPPAIAAEALELFTDRGAMLDQQAVNALDSGDNANDGGHDEA